MEQVKFRDAVGKTIAAFVEAKWGHEVLIVFTDKTFTVLDVDEYSHSICNGYYSRSDYEDIHLVNCGILTAQTLAEEAKQRELEAQKALERKEADERAYYEKLKAKFETVKTQPAADDQAAALGCIVVDIV